MPKPIKDEVVEDDAEQKTGSVPTLDEVHRVSQNQVEEEDENAEDDNKSDDDADEADESDSGSDGAEDDDEDKGADAGAGKTDADDASDSDEPAEPPAPPKPAESTVELDNDTSKPGPGKVAIKDAEGKTSYFNNLDEVPDDFEPVSYKALMVGTKALLQKEQDDDKAAKDAQVTADQEAHTKATNDLQAAWETDASKLVEGGQLPKDPTKLETAKNEVYNYIESEMKKGNIITSFTQAYKGMMYDKQLAEATDKQKQIDKAKKDRGAIVQSGSGGSSGGSSNTRGNRVIEAPPAGVGLDAVHARALNSL